MNKSQSSPQLLGLHGASSRLLPEPLSLNSPPTLRTSLSLDNLQDLESEFYFEEIFEGDGPLGIKFCEVNRKIVVRKIEQGTVASEYFGLVTDMILVSVNGSSVEHKKYDRVLRDINTIWDLRNEIKLKFKKPIYQEITKALNEHNLLKYYDKFVELGAKSFGDFEFVEYSDLIGMEMSLKERERFKKINPSCLIFPE
tara:strand:- start:228 stop:821 length:594 start_codon:yes stop_codon:yes gene_type:complete